MTSRHNDPVDYYLRLDDEEIHLNPYIGSRIELKYSGQINCIECNRRTNKSFSQGYCYPCFKKLPQTDLCLMSPERCHHSKGTCRSEEFAQSFCMQPHLVYLANSSGLKVGITRQENLPTRWIDQGAVQGLPIFKVHTRQQSGFVEVVFKDHISDKTNWRKMLKSKAEPVDLAAKRDELLNEVEKELDALRHQYGIQAVELITDSTVLEFNYPVEQYPKKVTSMNFDKTPVIEGVLWGIKGQYLIFDKGVINLRKFTAYDVEFTPLESSSSATSQLPLL
jgi:hypothetical protein